MFCAPVNHPLKQLARIRRRAFTLLEVMLAVMIMALIAIALYRFVVTSLQSIRISTEDTAQKGAVEALVAVLQAEFTDLPLDQPGALQGEAHKFNGKEADQVQWLTQAGNGLFTNAAEGQWKATLILHPDEKANTYTLGLERQLADGTDKKLNWLPLLPQVDAIEIRYYDPRLSAWIDKWANSDVRPALVRVRIWRKDQAIPYEVVIQLPLTQLPT
jgi:type II secretion system protein J